ncbi:MAG: hypothetical protein COA58_14160 [Bacteroidetes bacterium]|nr:MAG: hypothetical protein COA58_14160 [Bacteroidota bacterium]
MIGKKDKSAQVIGALNVLGEGTTIDGNLTSSGDLRIDGVVNGDVETKSKCVLGLSGRIVGNIHAKSCDISGKVDGNVKVSDLLLLKSSGKINGDINTAKIVVENGGEFNGSCTMGNAVSMNKSSEQLDAKTATA